ncbi:MAG: peptidoglycan DD-metalloendopeptidase family protein [Bacteroidales bacterium]|nr:peptidoglycan DD-metalloendopeptidase family protein [Bacteroidales bacterium]
MRLRPWVFTAVLAAAVSCVRSKDVPVDEAVRPVPPIGFFAEDFNCEESTVHNGETFSGLMNRLGMGMDEAYAMAQLCDSTFDVTKMRAGNAVRSYSDTLSNKLAYVVYDMDRIRQAVFQCRDSMAVWIYEKPVVKHRRYADVSISSSLWADMAKAGSSPALIMKLSDIFAWTVDFFGLQKDDRFRIIYGESEVEGESIGIDTVYLARFTSGDIDKYAVMFDQGDGGNVYWDDKGESLRRAFLKAPLEFKRISSGFSYARKHPVTGQVRPHTAVDYAAPTGTPVVAIGDGTVVSAGWAGGGGNTVKIRHNSVYTTSYMHLSKYGPGIKAGVHVQQGQVIGYVGMTGTATGPHLDFRVYQNGTAINPLTLESPSAEPLPEELMPAFDSTFHARLAEMDSLAVASADTLATVL